MLRDQIVQQSAGLFATTRIQPSDRVTHLFRTGQLARSAQQWHLEEMAHQLGLSVNNVVREFGKPDLLPEPPSVVYLVGPTVPPVDGEPVKIGYTRSIRDRLEALQPGSIRKLWLITYLPGGKALEREIHDRLTHDRIREDWFEMSNDVRAEFGLPLISKESA